MAIYTIPTTQNLASLRGPGHKAKIYATFLNPTVLWAAQVNNTSLNRGDTIIDFAGGVGVNFDAIESDMPVWVGSSPGLRDIGILRVRSITSSNGGASGTVTVARNTLNLSTGNHLTFVNDHPIMPKYPLIVGDPENADFRKDGDIVYSNQNDLLSPVVIAGPHRADFINDTLGYWQIESQLPDSYPMTPDATIVNYQVSAIPDTGVVININSSTGEGYIRFTTPGQYWIKYVVTDSNGVSQVSYRFYYAHSTNPTSPHYPHVDFELSGVTGDWEKGGWSASVVLYARSSYLAHLPDKTLAIIWAVSEYGNTPGPITLLPDKATNIITGYARQESLDRNRTQGLGRVQLTIESVDAVLSNHYMFSASLEAKSVTPTTWYEFRTQLTNTRAALHFWKWHSTLLETTDVIGLASNQDLRAYAELEDGTLYSMVDDMLRHSGIRHHVVADQGGRLHITPDIQLLTDNEREGLTNVFQIVTEDQSETITIMRNPVYRTPFVKTSGFSWDGSFITEESDECPSPPCPNVTALCASAPTDVPADDGPSIQTFDRQTFRSQAHANEIAGRYFAQINNPYPEIRLTYHGNYSGVFDVAYPLFWQIDITANTTPRSVAFNNLNLICRNVNLVINTTAGTIVTNVVFEPEAKGLPGVATPCISDLPTPTGDGGRPTSRGGAIITGSRGTSVYYGLVNWSLRTSENTLDLIEDPWWRIKRNTYNPANAIILRVGNGYLKRSTNAGLTWTNLTPITNPPNSYGDTPAPTAEDLEYHFVEGNLLYQDEFIVLARWRTPDNIWRSWILSTNDNFETYTWTPLGGGGFSSIDGQLGEKIQLGTRFVNEPICMGDYRNNAVAKLTDSKFVVTSRSYDGSPLMGRGFLRVGELFDDQITLYDQYEYDSCFFCPISGGDVFRISNTKALILYRKGTNELYMVVAEVDGTSITFGTPERLGTPFSEVAPHSLDCAVLNGEDNIVIAFNRYDSELDKVCIFFYTGRIIGLTPEFELQVKFHTYPNEHGTHALLTAFAIAPMGPHHLAFVYGIKDFNGPFPSTYGRVLARSALVTPTSLSFSEPLVVKNADGPYNRFVPDAVDLKPMGTGVFSNIVCGINCWIDLESFGEPTHVAVLVNLLQIQSFSGTGILAPNPITHTAWAGLISTTFQEDPLVHITTQGPDLGRIYTKIGTEADGPDPRIGGLRVIDFKVTPDSFTINYDKIIQDGNFYVTYSLFSGVNLYECVDILTYVDDDNSTFIGVAWMGECVRGGFFRTLGGSIGKRYGDTFYITGFDGTSLRLVIYDIPTLVQLDDIDLGQATESEINNKTFIAYPWGDYLNEETCYIYGRMNNPQGLGLSHIIVTNDGGATFTPLEQSWDGGICSALITSSNGTIYAIRRYSQTLSRLYVDLIEYPQVGFPAGVNPHALKLGGFDDLYVGADRPNGIMVMRAQYPYRVWTNITGNHGKTKEIMALEVL